ncbi:hypothetical protein AB0E04_47070 [Streptomyces sp. NPDC048251]|uniref:hypothetical protein n=1 Tax=Streptomyces sp. NPDC048251 TaxID=3154501 RepID=UPI00341D226F
MLLSFEDQRRIIGIVLETMKRNDFVIGGDFALSAHELRDAQHSERVCFYYTDPKVEDSIFGSDRSTKIVRDRMRQSGYPDAALSITRSPRLQFDPPLYVNGPPGSRVISFEDAIRIKIDRCSDRSETVNPGDFFDLYQISEKLGRFGVDGFISSRIDELNVENFRANLRRTSMDLSWSRKIREHIRKVSRSHAPDDVLGKLATLQRGELPITTATIRLSHAIAGSNEQQIQFWQKNLRIAIDGALQGGFQPQFIPPTQGEMIRYDRPVNATSQAADVARAEISAKEDSSKVDSYRALPNYATGAILGTLRESSARANGTGAAQSELPVVWQKVQSPGAARGPGR